MNNNIFCILGPSKSGKDEVAKILNKLLIDCPRIHPIEDLKDFLTDTQSMERGSLDTQEGKNTVIRSIPTMDEIKSFLKEHYKGSDHVVTEHQVMSFYAVFSTAYCTQRSMQEVMVRLWEINQGTDFSRPYVARQLEDLLYDCCDVCILAIRNHHEVDEILFGSEDVHVLSLNRDQAKPESSDILTDTIKARLVERAKGYREINNNFGLDALENEIRAYLEIHNII